jgi:hypothetical protein
MGDGRMATPSKYDGDRTDGSNIDCASGQEPSFAAQLHKTLNTIPSYTWYALPSGVLTFVNEGYANYLGLAKMILFGSGWRSMYLGRPTSSWYIPTTMKRRLESGQPVTELGLLRLLRNTGS